MPYLLYSDGKRATAWVKYDAKKKVMSLSNGSPTPSDAEPGAIYRMKRNGLKKLKQWRPPGDLIREYFPLEIGRVVFSHERHYASLNNRQCDKCHDDARPNGLIAWREMAISSDAHKKNSLANFCGGCHDGQGAVEINGTKTPIFGAGKTGNDRDCERCHVPRDHGQDYTDSHGEKAEKSRNLQQCAVCHRGASGVSAEDKRQAQDYKTAQLKLVSDPMDKTARELRLPPEFCMYCHSSDSKIKIR